MKKEMRNKLSKINTIRLGITPFVKAIKLATNKFAFTKGVMPIGVTYFLA